MVTPSCCEWVHHRLDQKRASNFVTPTTLVIRRTASACLALQGLVTLCCVPGTTSSVASLDSAPPVAPATPEVKVAEAASAPTLSTQAAPTRDSKRLGSALSVAEVVCSDDRECHVVSSEPLALPSELGRPRLVGTQVTEEVARARGWGADVPVYWIVLLDEHDHVVAAQRLTAAFKRGSEPDTDGLWSTFELTLPSGADPLATLRLWEPSPSGTAWGRNGFVRFSWPQFEPIEWEYAALHYVNPLLNSTQRWSWVDLTGSAEEGAFRFQFVLPQLTLDERFVSDAWSTADFERCASRLSSKNSSKVRGHAPSPHSLLALLSPQAELFLELEAAGGTAISGSASLEICFSGNVLRSEMYAPGVHPSCESFSLADPRPATLQVRKAPRAFRYKVSLPREELVDLPAITLVFRDPRTRQASMSSPFDFKTIAKLGDVLQFSPDRVTCRLEGEALIPRFAASNPQADLLDQTR